jgi:hypothetical protein
VRVVRRRRGSEQHHRAPDQLDAGGAKAVGDLEKHLFALRPLRCRRAHFHQLMRGQGAIDFLHHGVGEPAGSQQHDRIQVMRIRSQAQPLVARQCQFTHHLPISPQPRHEFEE